MKSSNLNEKKKGGEAHLFLTVKKQTIGTCLKELIDSWSPKVSRTPNTFQEVMLLPSIVIKNALIETHVIPLSYRVSGAI